MKQYQMARSSLYILVIFLSTFLPMGACTAHAEQTPQGEQTETGNPATVYMITNINAENIVRIYEALGREANGTVAVKISSGEAGGNYYLHPDLIAGFVQKVNGTIVENNTAYGGSRSTTEQHEKVIEDHGFKSIAPTDILDATGDEQWPTMGGSHLKGYVWVGDHTKNYDFMIVLSHFKGHAMGGFGGALKNMAIGNASKRGKWWVHSAGATSTGWQTAAQNDFLESMAESASAIVSHYGERILYINVMNNLSVDCDCSSHPAKPEMADVGILASLDPVALDQACVDLVFNSSDPGNKALIERINSRNGTLILSTAENIGVGTRSYRLYDLDHESSVNSPVSQANEEVEYFDEAGRKVEYDHPGLIIERRGNTVTKIVHRPK